jgi:MFS transporter, SP family, arabinose:H+ symporter
VEGEPTLEERTPRVQPIHLGYVGFLACTAALGGLLFGFDVAIITGAGPFITRKFALTDFGLGWAFSSLLFGCVLGSFLVGRITDRYGRRRLLLADAALFAITSMATAMAPSFTAFVVARFLGGLAVGGVSLLSPMYIAEIAPARIRGRLGTFYQLSIISGICISYAVNYALRDFGANNWRWMFMTGVVPSVIFFLLIAFAPETPRFLALHGRPKDALAILRRIGGADSAETVLAEIQATSHEGDRNWRQLFRPGVRRAVTVSIALAVLIHVSGINTIIDFAPVIFQSAGWKIEGALASTLVIGAVELTFTVASLWMIDRFGRKPLYIGGSIGMAVSLAALVVSVGLGRFEGMLVLIPILAYLAFFSACIGPVFWTLVPEIFPNDIRGMAMMIPVLVQWMANAIVVLVFPYAFHVIGKASTFGFLAAMCIFQAVVTLRFVPETRNKHLEEIEAFWAAGTAERRNMEKDLGAVQ